MKKFLVLVPTGVWSVLITLFIAYLSLDSDPLGSSAIGLFPHADKVIHFLMYFGCTCVYIFEYQKHLLPHHTRLDKELALTLFASVLGLLMEIAQVLTDNERSYELLDWVADTAGAIAAFFFMHYCFLHVMRVKLSRPRRKHRKHRRHHNR